MSLPRSGKVLLGTAAAVGVPVAAAAAPQQLARGHPAAAVGVAIGMELAIAAVLVVGKLASAPTTRRLEQWGESLDRALWREVSRYGRQYRQWVLDSLRFLDAKGLATVGDFTPELDEVYVDVSLAQRAPQQVPGDLLADVPVDVTRRLSIWDFLDQPAPVVLAVIGAPGSGKTTLLGHVARRVAKTPRERHRDVPVLLHLRDHAHTVSEDARISLPQLLRQAVPALPIGEPAGWWESRLQRGRCVVLLDGLDEVASVAERRDITLWISKQIAIYPRNDYVVTSRPHGYRSSLIESATTLQVRSFTLDQVRRFLHGWYRAVERRATGLDGREVEMLAEREADDLLDRLAATPALYELTVNPLLLTMIAHVHRYRGSLPGSRADLYSEVCQVMLWRRQEAKKLLVELPGANKERLLSRLAYLMMGRRVRGLSRRQVLETVRPGLRRLSTHVTAEDFLADVGSNGLLVEREKDLYEFAHLTFQEYLAAKHIQDHGLGRVLVDAVDDPWWREVTLLYAAGADTDPIARACLAAGTTVALSLAFECAQADAELAPDLRNRLTGVMTAAFAGTTDAEHRQLIAGVLASRHLRRLVATSAGARICPHPILTSLYWLFLADTGTPPPDGPCPGDPNSTTPLTGAWGSDAVAFVGWLNGVASRTDAGPHGGGTLYRLPTEAELQTVAGMPGPAAQVLASSASCAWTAAAHGATPTLWVHSGRRSPRVVTYRQMLAASAADLRRSCVLNTMLSITMAVASRALNDAAEPIRERASTISAILSAARAGAHAADRYRDVQSAQNIALELSRDLARAHGLASTLLQALTTATMLDPAVEREIAFVLAAFPAGRLIRDLTRASSFEREVAISLDWSSDLGLHTANGHARALSQQLAGVGRQVAALPPLAAPHAPRAPSPRVGGPPRQVPAGLRLARALGLDGDIRVDRLPAGQQPDLGATLPRVMGFGLAKALLTMLQEESDDGAGADADERFAHRFLSSTLAEPTEMEISLERSAETAGRIRTASLGTPATSAWAAMAAQRLVEAARPVMSRERPITPAHAASIRLPALALAVEADRAAARAARPADRGLGDRLRELSGAVTLMQSRGGGRRQLETIVLAHA